jgi:hypothetical protein
LSRFVPASGYDLQAMEDGGSIDRRELIKRAAVVTGAVWTAPLIIESVTTSAAAVTVSCVCPTGKTMLKTKLAVDGVGGTNALSWKNATGFKVHTSAPCDLGPSGVPKGALQFAIPEPGAACKPACWDSIVACSTVNNTQTIKQVGATSGFTLTLKNGCTWLSAAASGCNQTQQSSPGCAGTSQKISGIAGSNAFTNAITFTGCSQAYAVYLTYCC